jgi:hypothetical protein
MPTLPQKSEVRVTLTLEEAETVDLYISDLMEHRHPFCGHPYHKAWMSLRKAIRKAQSRLEPIDEEKQAMISQ